MNAPEAQVCPVCRQATSWWAVTSEHITYHQRDCTTLGGKMGEDTPDPRVVRVIEQGPIYTAFEQGYQAGIAKSTIDRIPSEEWARGYQFALTAGLSAGLLCE